MADRRYPEPARAELEVQLAPKLQHPRIIGRGYLAERRIRITGIDGLELRVIEGIERFRAKLQIRSSCFGEREGLEQGKVEVEQPRTHDGVLAGIAKALVPASRPRRCGCGE